MKEYLLALLIIVFGVSLYYYQNKPVETTMGVFENEYFSAKMLVPITKHIKDVNDLDVFEVWRSEAKSGDFYAVSILFYDPIGVDETTLASEMVDLLIEEDGGLGFGKMFIIQRPMDLLSGEHTVYNDSVRVGYEGRDYEQVFMAVTDPELNRVYGFNIGVTDVENSEERVQDFFGSIVIK